MLRLTFFQVDTWKGSSGNGVSAGLSSLSNSARRLALYVRITRSLRSAVRSAIVAPMKPGRNDPCHCGSGQKYKKCHLGSDDAARSAELSAAAAAAAEAQAKADAEAEEKRVREEAAGRPNAPRAAAPGSSLPKTVAPRPPTPFRRKAV